MARTLDDKVASFRKRAEELRTTAEGMKDAAARESLLALAVNYDKMSESAQFLLTSSAASQSLGTASSGTFKADYLRHAEECDALAKKASTHDERKMILDMADTWRKLVNQREKLASLKNSH